MKSKFKWISQELGPARELDGLVQKLDLVLHTQSLPGRRSAFVVSPTQSEQRRHRHAGAYEAFDRQAEKVASSGLKPSPVLAEQLRLLILESSAGAVHENVWRRAASPTREQRPVTRMRGTNCEPEWHKRCQV
jgi:hypothetical protein